MNQVLKSKALFWALRLIVVIILMQSLFYKFSGAEESVYVFSKIGLEPVGRITVGIIELLACIFLIINRTALLGSILGLIMMGGALAFHFTKLGFVVQDDSGQLFIYACIAFLSCVFLLIRSGIQLKFNKSINNPLCP